MEAKRILRAALALTLTAGACTLPASAAGVKWEKEPASWAVEQMEDLAGAGILGQGTYNPTVIMNRGGFCYFMVNIIHREGRRDLLSAATPVAVDYFSDVTSPDGFGGRYNMYTAAAYGLTEGALVDGKRLADCDSNLTREQAAKMMCALVDALEMYTGAEIEEVNGSRSFADADAISPWAAASVNRVSALGLLKGDEAGRFNPQGILTFQEACVMLDRAFRAAEAANWNREEALGIGHLNSALEVETEWAVHTTGELYLLGRNGEQSVLQIRGRDGENPCVRVERFDENGHSAGIQDIPVELDFCAGFYEGEEAYYLAFGQDNMEEDDGKEVYRIVRYDKSWNRLAAASVTGGESYTTQPYRSTSHVAMAEEDGVLILHTSRLRYLTPKDGLRHQSNITIKISTPDMRVLSVSPPFPGNHVSHSFAQYVAFDGGEPVYADHGDAYPRGFALNLDAATGYGKELNFFPFSGEIGQNATYAIPGGLGISGDNYLFAGASSPQKGNDKLEYANAFLAVIPKEGYPNSRPEIKWLTGFPADGEEYVDQVSMVEMNSNTFVVMWQTVKKSGRTTVGDFGDFCYAVFDGQGNQIGQTKALPDFMIPNADPLVEGGSIRWVRPEAGPYGVFGSYPSRHLKAYGLEIDLNDESQGRPAVIQPEASVPAAFTLNRTDMTFSAPGETFVLKVALTPEDAKADVTWSSSDPSVASVSWNGVLTAVSKGTATIRVKVEGVGTKTCIVRCNFVDSEVPTSPSAGGSSSTPLPADGRTDYYRADWDNGKWMALEVLEGKTIRLTGCMPDLPDYYNYVVLQAYEEQAEVPLIPGRDFALEVTVDTARFREEDQSKMYYITPMVCQNHVPGKKNLAGFSFDGAKVFLTLNDEGECTFRVVE